MILTRKVGIAFCALIFRTNPGFMLASVLCVLFIAFSLQTRHSPYMSASQRKIVLAEHALKVDAGHRTHLHISKNLQHVKKREKQYKRTSTARRRQVRFNDVHKASKSKEMSLNTEYLFDYNTVELALLFCAVLVSLAGVMFESDRFQIKDNEGNRRYAWQRGFVTYVVIFTVLGSFVYLGVVILNELTGWTPVCIKKKCLSKKNAILSAAEKISKYEPDGNIEMGIMNPVLTQ